MRGSVFAVPSIHATAVAIDGEALLIFGASRTGKSRLAVALIACATPTQPILLVGDDRIVLGWRDGRLVARPHPRIAGFLERRGLGIVAMDWVEAAPVGGLVELLDAGRATPSPACGRRWPDEVGSDEGAGRDARCRPSPPLRHLPHPTPLRGATFSRKREKEVLRHVPCLSLAPDEIGADHVLAWWAARGAGATHLAHSAPAPYRPRAKD